MAWTEGGDAPHGALERVAEALAQAAGVPRALTVPTSATTLWGWIATSEGVEADALRGAVEAAPSGVRVAAGATRPGIAGFRRSHEEAVAAQRLLAGSASPHRFVSHREIDVIALLGGDEARLRAFVTETLGPLGGRDATTTRMRETVRLFLQEGDNAARTAERLGTHRNTVLHRVARAEELLGHPLRDRRLALGVALEADFRLGITAPLTAPSGRMPGGARPIRPPRAGGDLRRRLRRRARARRRWPRRSRTRPAAGRGRRSP